MRHKYPKLACGNCNKYYIARNFMRKMKRLLFILGLRAPFYALRA